MPTIGHNIVIPAEGDWGQGFKQFYRIPDGNLTSLRSIAETPAGIFYITKERLSPAKDLGPMFVWSAEDFIDEIEGAELWIVEYERSNLCDKVSRQMLTKYLKEREQVVSFWDKCRRFGHDRLYDYFNEKRAGLMPRPYGSILADSIILKGRKL